MNRRLVSTLALLTLLALTAATWRLHTQGGDPAEVAGVTIVKCGVVLGVFLELDRAWRGWGLLALAMVGAVAGGAALVMSGPG